MKLSNFFLFYLLIPVNCLVAQSVSLQYAPNSSYVSTANQQQLAPVVRACQSDSQLAVSITYYSEDEAVYDRTLALKRAKNLQYYLRLQGVKMAKVQVDLCKKGPENKAEIRWEALTPNVPFSPLPDYTGGFAALQEQLVEVQYTTLPVDRDTFLRGKKGTVFLFDAYSFRTASGDTVKDPVEIELKEAYTYADMLAMDLSTQTDKELLESGGMLQVSVTNNGEKVFLLENAGVTIAMPTDSLLPNMYPFSGKREETGQLVWEKMGDKMMRGFGPAALGGLAESSPGLIPSIDINNPQTGEGPFKDIFGGGDRRFRLFRRKRWSKMKTTNRTFPPNNSVSKYNRNSSNLKATMRKINRGDEIALTDLTSRELNYYVFQASELDWINCDRFMGTPTDEITTFPTPLAYNTDINCKLIFTDMKAMLAPVGGTKIKGRLRYPENFKFKRVPIGQPVTIIAIRYDGDQPELAIKETVVSKEGSGELVFKKYTMEELKSALSRLDIAGS